MKSIAIFHYRFGWLEPSQRWFTIMQSLHPLTIFHGQFSGGYTDFIIGLSLYFAKVTTMRRYLSKQSKVSGDIRVNFSSWKIFSELSCFCWKLDSFFYSHLQCRLRGSLPLPLGFPRLWAQLGIWWLGSVATKTSGKWRRWVSHSVLKKSQKNR